MAASVIVKSDLNSAMKYCGAVSAKIGGKRKRVLFEVPVDELSLPVALESAKRNRNIISLVYEGLDCDISCEDASKEGVNITWVLPVAGNISVSDISRYVETLPKGMSLTLRFPEDFNDIDFIFELSSAFPDIRICGNTLFSFDGLRVGIVGRDILEKRGIDFDTSVYLVSGECNAIPTLFLDDVTLEEVSAGGKSKGVRKSSKKSKSGDAPKPRNSKVQKFRSFLFNSGDDWLR